MVYQEKSKTSRKISNLEKRVMCIGVLDQNFIRNFYRSIGYTLVPSSNFYEENKATIKRVLEERITPQARSLDVLITDLHEHRLRKTFNIADTISNTQLTDLKSKRYGGQSLRDIIQCAISPWFYPSQGSDNHTLLRLEKFHVPTNREVNPRDTPDV